VADAGVPGRLRHGHRPARLALGLRGDAPTRFGVYQLVLLALNALVGVLVVARLRALRRR
jgi:hypothetical protein